MAYKYLSGPMTGMAELNYDAFNEAASYLRKLGHTVWNPAEVDGGDTTKARSYYLAKDIHAVVDSEAVVLLPGWKHSAGAKLEVDVARGLGIPILELVDGNLQPPKISETILEEAQGLVYGPRQASYGHPYDDFSRTATMWGAILGIDVTPKQVAMCMIAVKMSRLCNATKRDSIVDIAGYAATLAMVEDYAQTKRS